MNNFKRLLVAIMASAMISSTFVTGFATNIMARTPVYTIQMVGNTLTLMKNGVAFMPYRLSTVAGADAVKLYQTATGEVRISFVDSTGKTRLIEIGKEANLEVKGTFPSLVIDKSVINTAVTLATHNKNDRNAIPTIIRDLQVNGAITLQIPVGAEVQKATVSNKETKVDIAQGSDVKNVTVADGVVVGGTGSSDANVSTDTSLGGSTSGGSTSGGSGSSGGSNSGGSNSGGSNSGDDESDNEPAIVQYNVTFKDSGAPVLKTVKVNKDGKVPEKDIPSVEEPTGYTFLGWYNGTTKWNFETNKVTKSITLVATFKENDTSEPDTDEKEKFTVTFMDGENKIDSTTVEIGKTVDKPTDPTKEKFEFKGWYADSKFETVWTFETPITKDTIIYAKFTADPVTPPEDKTPPKLASVEATLEAESGTITVEDTTLSTKAGAKVKSIVITLDEDATLVDDTKNKITIGENAAEYGEFKVEGTTITITPTGTNLDALAEGTYTLTLAAGLVQDKSENKNAAITLTLEVAKADVAPDKEPPTLTSVILKVDGENAPSKDGKLTVAQGAELSKAPTENTATLSEEVTLVGAAETAIIKITGQFGTNKDITENYATFTIASDKKTLHITPNEGTGPFTIAGEYTLTIAENILQDTSENKNPNQPLTLTLTVTEDTKAPTLDSVTLKIGSASVTKKATETLPVTVGDKLGAEVGDNTATLSEIVKFAPPASGESAKTTPLKGDILISGPFGSANLTDVKYGEFTIDEEDGKTLNLTFAEPNTGAFTIAGDYTLKIKAGVLVDRVGKENENITFTINVKAQGGDSSSSTAE